MRPANEWETDMKTCTITNLIGTDDVLLFYSVAQHTVVLCLWRIVLWRNQHKAVAIHLNIHIAFEFVRVCVNTNIYDLSHLWIFLAVIDHGCAIGTWQCRHLLSSTTIKPYLILLFIWHQHIQQIYSNTCRFSSSQTHTHIQWMRSKWEK